MKTKTNTKAGGIRTINHNQAMKVKTSTKAGGLRTVNHNESIRVRSNVKAGGITIKNHNESIRVRSNVKAGGTQYQHNETISRSNNPKRKESKCSNGFGIKVMNVRTGIKAGWVSRNYK